MEVVVIPRTEVQDDRLWSFLVSLSDTVAFTPDQIQEAVCHFFKISISELKSKRRFAKIIKAREYFAFLAYDVFGIESLENLGQIIEKHHSTVIHYRDSLGHRYRYSRKYRAEFNYFIDTFYPEYKEQIQKLLLDGQG